METTIGFNVGLIGDFGNPTPEIRTNMMVIGS